MKRTWLAWVVFGAATAGMLAVMAWGSAKILQLASAEDKARTDAALEESVRLALWRMETALAALVVQENSRPYTAYAPSAAGATSPFVRQRFQLDSGGAVVAGKIPRSLADPKVLSAAIPKTWISVQQSELPSAKPVAAPLAQQQLLPNLQTQRNIQEFAARGQLNAQNSQVLVPQLTRLPKPAAQPRAIEVKTGVMAPMWAGDELILARHVQVGSKEFLQGCSLDLVQVRSMLLTGIKDLLPAASLIPERERFDPAEGRTLASLPLRLVPGPMPSPPGEDRSPLLFSLRIAWVSMIVAIIAVGVLLMGAITLSQRRAAFVSAVTHELRTPLTTFRMYTEMLVEGMANDPAKQNQYHQTLHREAGRLMHLVENVLSYARLERGRYGERETVTVGDLIDRMRTRLTEHASLAGMDLALSITPDAAAGRVTTDTAAIERILFNLTDNACKYAREATDRRIHIDLTTLGSMARITVTDHGPGLAAARGLFQPFRKSAGQAARSAPGVGIGLPLSRRLARAAGGELKVVDSTEGACLLLELPLLN
ncbi:MAG: HAMP domain-containing histidine kinase [Acidobacteria bacterium]|nr:HAMP domain-containing histidine kinase [Acidobacteriota bacterium]